MSTEEETATSIAPVDMDQVDRANATGLQPVVFVHGLWLLSSSWGRWAAVFEDAGYSAVTPGWPDDPATVADANATPEVFAKKSVKQVADHFEEVIQALEKKPAVIGHSFGGLMVEILAGRGLAAASVAAHDACHRVGRAPEPGPAARGRRSHHPGRSERADTLIAL